MSVVRLDDDDLDDEDRAILAEIAKKGYYCGRPKSEACPPPAKIDVQSGLAPTDISHSEHAPRSRAEFDEFQKKWDRFDNDKYLEELEAELTAANESAGAGLVSPSADTRPSIQRTVVQDHEFKIVLVGDGGVGKTTLVKRHLSGEFHKKRIPNAGLQVYSLTFCTNCGNLCFNVWELSFGERHYQPGCVRDGYFTKGEGAIIMFDRTSRISYRNAPNWHREIVRACGEIPTVVVGNKVDAHYQQVKAKDILYHRKKQLQYYDLSVRRNYNFEKPFLWLARRLTNQPNLQFARQYAEAPWVRLDVASFEQHDCKLSEAQNVAIGDDDSDV